jgi:hypothetical protein
MKTPLKLRLERGLRPTGLGSGIDKDRPDYTVYSGEWDVCCANPGGSRIKTCLQRRQRLVLS